MIKDKALEDILKDDRIIEIKKNILIRGGLLPLPMKRRPGKFWKSLMAL